MFKVIAINDSNRPNDIPNTKWIKKDEVYTVIKMSFLNMQNKALGFKLEEINIDDCFPYQYFSSDRFKPLTEEDSKTMEFYKPEVTDCFIKNFRQ